MGRNSGGIVNVSAGGSNSKAVTAAIESSKPIHTIKDRSVVRELQRGISRFHSVMGVRERSIRIADLSPIGALGVTYLKGDGNSSGILLNSKFFNRRKKEIATDVVKNHYNTGFKNKTNAPLQHTITHELAHATWNAGMKSAKAKAAGIEIKNLYKRWKKDSRKSGYGTYGRTNVSEFWAEAVTKAIHGKSDRYTKRVKSIARKYNL